MKNLTLKNSFFIILISLATAVFSYGQIASISASISQGDVGKKPKCNRKTTNDGTQGANVCDGSTCSWVSGKQGNDFGKCG
jgi:hypothetical protein